MTRALTRLPEPASTPAASFAYAGAATLFISKYQCFAALTYLDYVFLAGETDGGADIARDVSILVNSEA